MVLIPWFGSEKKQKKCSSPPRGKHECPGFRAFAKAVVPTSPTSGCPPLPRASRISRCTPPHSAPSPPTCGCDSHCCTSVPRAKPRRLLVLRNVGLACHCHPLNASLGCAHAQPPLRPPLRLPQRLPWLQHALPPRSGWRTRSQVRKAATAPTTCFCCEIATAA